MNVFIHFYFDYPRKRKLVSALMHWRDVLHCICIYCISAIAPASSYQKGKIDWKLIEKTLLSQFRTEDLVTKCFDFIQAIQWMQNITKRFSGLCGMKIGRKRLDFSCVHATSIVWIHDIHMKHSAFLCATSNWKTYTSCKSLTFHQWRCSCFTQTPVLVDAQSSPQIEDRSGRQAGRQWWSLAVDPAGEREEEEREIGIWRR